MTRTKEASYSTGRRITSTVEAESQNPQLSNNLDARAFMKQTTVGSTVFSGSETFEILVNY